MLEQLLVKDKGEDRSYFKSVDGDHHIWIEFIETKGKK